MSELRASRDGGGELVVLGIPKYLADVIRTLPELLGADQPDVVRRRLFPDPCDDEEIAAEWRRTQHPELFALLADAKRIVEHDLASLRHEADSRAWRLSIPSAHVPAWISALNAARLSLGALHDVTSVDLDPENEPTLDDRGLAILHLDLYAWLQGTLIEAAEPQD